MLDKLKSIKDRYDEVSAKLLLPEVLSDNKEYVRLAKEHKNLEPIVEKYTEYKKVKDDLLDAEEMLKGETGDMKEFLEAEILEAHKKIEELDEEIKILLLPKDEKSAEALN